MEVRLLFTMVDLNKRRLAKKWRENDFGVLRAYCNEVLEKTGIEAQEEEIIPSHRFRSKVELVYWKKPSEHSTAE